MASVTALVFDLDGTLVDSVYQHVLSWHEALQEVGIELSVNPTPTCFWRQSAS
jgi:beta-phosphoglucomutase-like phosphatase (HAD superfamily)